MPTYEYECKSCSHSFEAFQSIKDDPLEKCPQCGKKLRRLINGGSGIIFKGSGFYVTDKGKSSAAVSAPSSKKDDAGSSGGSGESPAASASGGSPATPAPADSGGNSAAKTGSSQPAESSKPAKEPAAK